jgi:hypothetical protein
LGSGNAELQSGQACETACGLDEAVSKLSFKPLAPTLEGDSDWVILPTPGRDLFLIETAFQSHRYRTPSDSRWEAYLNPSETGSESPIPQA